MRTTIASIAVALLWLLCGPCMAGDFTHSDGDFASVDWTQQLVLTGSDGSGSGTSKQELDGGNPGAFREVSALRASGTAGSPRSENMPAIPRCSTSS